MREQEFFFGASPNFSKLIRFGFTKENDSYEYTADILEKHFKMRIKIPANGDIKTTMTDADTGDIYILHLTDACGAFVGRVRSEYERVLSEIVANCFDKNVFKSDYAHRVIAYVKEKFGDELEYLWQKFSDNAIWRRKDNKKWYGALLTVSERKLGLNSDKITEIIDIRAEACEVLSLVDNQKYFPGYHMNKQHWLTMRLDGSLPIEEIFGRIDKSYDIALKK